MAYKVSYYSRENMVELVLLGEVNEPESKVCTIKSIDTGQKHDCINFLVDASEMEIGPSNTDIYYRTEQYREKGVSNKTRAALVLPKFPKALETMMFWELVCKNQGWNVKSFENRDEAIEWLTSNKGNSDNAKSLMAD